MITLLVALVLSHKHFTLCEIVTEFCKVYLRIIYLCLRIPKKGELNSNSFCFYMQYSTKRLLSVMLGPIKINTSGGEEMDSSKIGHLILKLRKEKGYTQKQLAELMNLSDRTISKWERGQGCPDISLLQELSSLLGIT